MTGSYPNAPYPEQDPGWQQPGSQPGWQQPGSQSGDPYASGGAYADGGPYAGGVPTGGYAPPPHLQHQAIDPLISPDYSGWWSRGVAIARRGWRPLAALQAIGVVVTLLVQAPLAAYMVLVEDDLNSSFASNPTGEDDLTPFLVVIALAFGGVLLSLVLTAMVTIAVVHVGVSVAIGAPVRIGDALRLAARRVLPLIGWHLAALPVYIVGLCLCVLPVFYAVAVFTVLPAVVAIERTNAFSRCFTLFHRDLGPAVARIATIIGILFVTSVVGGLVSAAFEVAIASSVDGTTGLVAGSAVSTLLGALIGGALAILLAPLTLTAYADMRARVEPVNTFAIAQELNVVPPATQWSPWPGGPPAPRQA